MDWSNYREHIDSIPGRRFDTSRLVDDPGVFDAVVADLAAPWEPEEVDLVVGIDALGFVFGTALARDFEVGFVPSEKVENSRSARAIESRRRSWTTLEPRKR